MSNLVTMDDLRAILEMVPRNGPEPDPHLREAIARYFKRKPRRKRKAPEAADVPPSPDAQGEVVGGVELSAEDVKAFTELGKQIMDDF